MKILVLNCGSSSLKYQLIDMESMQVITKGNYQRIGEDEAFLEYKINGSVFKIEKTVLNHGDALQVIFNTLLSDKHKILKSLEEISGIGHRIVHGGEIFNDSVIVTDEVISQIEECGVFAPLHNYAAARGIKACKEMLPNVPMVAVFDTAFHQTMPKQSYIYPIPYEYYEKYGVRKYGAHGTSHDYVSKRVAEISNKKREDLKIVTCHLGQGASICAIKNGKCVDTSMGLTPLGGITMVTRSGDLDPSVVTYIMEKENLTPQDMTKILNTKSGISSIARMAPDFRKIEESAAIEKTSEAMLGVEKFATCVAEYIARYGAVMEGIDIVVFTGGIGENQFRVREKVCNKLKFLGIELDSVANEKKGEEIQISSEASKIKVFVIPTDEEMEIAKETLRLIKK